MRALVVGISDAPPLEFLQGAVNGARAFAKWTQDQKIPTELLTDEEKPVGFQDVRDAFGRLFADRAVRIDRLFVYFAGHGLTRDASEDLWLLSEWWSDQRAVAVGALRRKLEQYGIRQLCVISDACRSLPNSGDSADLTPDPVLGRGPFDTGPPKTDLLIASRKFRAAYMVPGQQPDDDRCIFSGVLEEALSGAKDGAFDEGRITSSSLVTFLEQEVPVRAATYRVELNPFLTAGFLRPDDAYLAAKPEVPPVLKAWPTPSETITAAMSAGNAAPARGGQRGWSTRAGARPPVIITPELNEVMKGIRRFDGTRSGTVFNERVPDSSFESAEVSSEDEVTWNTALEAEHMEQRARGYAQGYGEEFRPTHFETGAGFATEGAIARSMTLGPSAFASAAPPASAAQARQFSWWSASDHGGGHLSRPVPLVIELDQGRRCGAAALPGFIATFTIDGGGVTSLIYRHTYSPPDSGLKSETAVAELRAGLLAGDAAYDAAARFRDEKEDNPVKGVLAAYLYDAQGDVESVRRTAWYVAMAGLPIPLDMAILGRLPVMLSNGQLLARIPQTLARKPRSAEEARRSWTHDATSELEGRPVAGLFPWLRQGWALLDGDEPWLPPGLIELRRHLLPFQFTTLDAAGGKRLHDIINAGA